MTQLPERGRPWEDLRRDLARFRRRDLDYRRGRQAAFVWYADPEVEAVARKAYAMYMVENGLGLRAFPSLARMEAETLAIVRGLLGGDGEDAGIFTSGGTESIFLA